MTSTSEPLVWMFLKAGRLARSGRTDEARVAYAFLVNQIQRELLQGRNHAPHLAQRMERAAPTATLESLRATAILLLELSTEDKICPERALESCDASDLRPMTVARFFFSLVMVILVFGTVLAFTFFFSPAQKVERTQKALVELRNFLVEATDTTLQPLTAIIENSCSECPCKERGPLATMPEGDVCRANWRIVLDKVFFALHGRKSINLTGRDLLPSAWKRDAWDAPYLLNENKDQLRSAGPDGLPDTLDDLVQELHPATYQKKVP